MCFSSFSVLKQGLLSVLSQRKMRPASVESEEACAMGNRECLGTVDIQCGYAYSLASLKRKKLLSTTPLKLALNSFIFALKDSAAAFVDLLI